MSTGAIRCPTLLTGPPGEEPIGAFDLDAAGVLSDAVLAWRDGVVAFAGPSERFDPVREGLGFPTAIRLEGAVVPGFVDCHTHLPFRGWRSEEFEARLAGRTYRDLHGGGGIFRSARLLAEATDDEVIAFCLPLATEMLAHGTTAVELKTGYGLSIERELRQARLARRLASEMPQTARVTLLACHAVPSDRAREDWVEEVCRRLIPEAASGGLADAVDVYVEDIAFSVGDLESVAEAASRHGLALRCHADQLGASGAAEAAVRLGARGADHLNHLSQSGVQALGRRGTVGVLLPVSTLFLRAKPPPVDDLIAGGAALAVATDFNPGTSPCLSLPEALAVGASLYGLSPLTGIVAATHNAAWVLGLQGRHGSLRPGARADFVVLDAPDPAMVPYRPGHNPVRETWIGGARAHP